MSRIDISYVQNETKFVESRGWCHVSEIDGVFTKIKFIALDIICNKSVAQCGEKANNKANEIEKGDGFLLIF